MVLSTEHNIYTRIIEAYFRTGVQVNGTWEYSQRLCLDNFQEDFPHFAVMPKDFYACLTNCVGLFRESDSGTVGLIKKVLVGQSFVVKKLLMSLESGF
jgi:hypothetical protein